MKEFEKEARRKSKFGEALNDEESRYMIRYTHPTSCCSFARSTKSAHRWTPPALTHDCHCVYISYRARLDLKKAARLAMDAQTMLDNPKIKLAALRTPGMTKSFSHPTLHKPQYDCHLKYDANLHVESTEQMEASKHDVFAQQTIGGLTLLEMTRHNKEAFANRLSPPEHLAFFYMIYAWITCQRVSAVIMPHNPIVTVSA